MTLNSTQTQPLQWMDQCFLTRIPTADSGDETSYSRNSASEAGHSMNTDHYLSAVPQRELRSCHWVLATRRTVTTQQLYHAEKWDHRETASGGGERQVPLNAANTNPCGSSPRRETCIVMEGWQLQWPMGRELTSQSFLCFLSGQNYKGQPFNAPIGGENSTALKYARVSCFWEEITLAFYTLFWKMGAEETFKSL